MRRGDIYLVSLDPTEGREQRGSRPVLVVSPAEFNEATNLPVICPITNGGDFARRIGFAVPVTGIKTTGVVRCDQPRVLDFGARNARKVDTLPASIMEEVLAKLATIFA
ncbi:type II toxin-antitoxin system PemK/MazF family toxin [Ferrovum myxofaciens]|jgi:mRNA interferase ChpB|uniref:Type II toxin-antitoxin system PemK/MazF family toxin n=3 Tax=root TaxID=1 RepID=A0A859ACQ7_9PROT|nr:type II toxin-antitoxin system PemK/MazF family toxin [Ferrovum myxofaciens]KXW57310.1 mRNA interferase PemK [Ferrovum myxofaciens]MBU6995918.1 type II toxin-antitoxin system PemK/MazF family toxin [Ferrovum myxofaciens]QKE39371.1 MAG: type II toxin-antitoxin system PemK/MazF family toxin [Ferrovum myxofaciens]QKE41916.1 MAG: type II toxin-antitoxin system PemK/MazF family toxin [Ferrovum myxofaciens]QWY74645.1 MAG: type II toxin-antitoxin system PemK/MazF family toxin [Ferrovum myxofaciens